jgi:hypothetical protein
LVRDAMRINESGGEMRNGIIAAVCLFLAWGLAWGQDSLKPVQGSSPLGTALPDTADFKPAFERIARAWEGGRPETLDLFLGEGQVTITLPRVAGGVLSRDQAEYVLRDMFTYSLTERFKFVKYDTFLSEGVAGIAEWSLRPSKARPARMERISVWLVREGKDKPRWVIREIKEAGQ